MSLLANINPEKLPQHIAIIMDGNGRWAKQRGAARIFGHRSATKAVRDTTEACAELGVGYLTLYAFSTENWKRPKAEVNALMQLLVDSLKKELPTLMDNDVRLHTIGHTAGLPSRCIKGLQDVMKRTRDNQRMCLNLALNYGARADITQAVQGIAERVARGELDVEQIDEHAISHHLSTADMPDPELMIRTSGEHRVSNFLLWEIAYAEVYFTPILWPDFRREHLYEAIVDYQGRERRFGKTSEQIDI